MSWSDLTSVARLRQVESRSISAENPDGSPGGGGRATDGAMAEAARDLGLGWKLSPCVRLAPESVFDVATIEGTGKITHIWIATENDKWRSLILRAYWDGDAEPAVEVPLGDFFCQGTPKFAQINSIVISTNTQGALNSYWPMPFQTGAWLSVENLSDEEIVFFYQVDYELGGDVSGLGYLHAQWRRSNPLPDKTTHVLVEGIEGQGHYVGTYMSWAPKNSGWWGEGEIKFYLDDDRDHPTICGTGTEDYFGGAWCLVVDRRYVTYSGPYLGFPQAIEAGGGYASQSWFSLYRWHLPDPIHFAHRLGRVDIQALGWRSAGRYLPLRDDIASTAYFYLDRTSTTRPPVPTADELEII